jgi:hypothetical protein
MVDGSIPSGDGAAPALQLFGAPYLDFLQLLDTHLAPQSYLEVGTNQGESLSRISCDAIAVDTEFLLKENRLGRRNRSFLFRMTSDAFFRDHNVRSFFPHGIDLAFLDGMHRVEYLLRDFINTEAVAHSRSLILLHDCLPLNARMARRTFVPGGPEEGDNAHAWTGDVWKVLPVLKQYRPDLRIMLLDCPPTGLVAISHLDPESTVLDQNYHEILDTFAPMSIESFGLTQLWSEFPLVDSRSLYDNPDTLTSVLSVY